MRKVYLSYRNGQEQYVEALTGILGEAVVQGHIASRVKSSDSEARMQRIRNEFLKDSEVTIYLIGEGGSNFDKDVVKFQKLELQASLYENDGIKRNGLIGVVLPEMYEKLFFGELPCEICGDKHHAIHAFDDVVLHEFYYNYFLPLPEQHDHWDDDDRFCVLVRWDEFMKEPETFIELAYNKTRFEVSRKVKWDVEN